MRKLQIEPIGKGGLVERFSVCAASNVASHPSFRVTRNLGIDAFVLPDRESTVAMKGDCRRQKPRFEFPVGKYHGNFSVRHDLARTIKGTPSDFSRAVVIRIKNDDNPPVIATLGGSQEQLPAKLILFVEKSVALDANWLKNMGEIFRRFPLCQPAQQNWKRGNLAIAFNNGGDISH